MEKFSVHEVVEQAVQTERLGNSFYTGMARKFHDKYDLKKLFETLAAQEYRHEQVFLQLKDRISDEEAEGWDEVTLYLKALAESEFFLGKGKSLTSMNEAKTAAEAVTFALGFEKETLLFYYSLKDVVGGQEILDAIIREEKSHIIWLNDLRKSLS
jgi:rubrerythrin